MTLTALPTPILLGLAALLAGAAVGTSAIVVRRVGWRPAGGIALIAATPLVPHVPVALGFSLDDVLPIIGVLVLAREVVRPGFRAVPSRILAIGLVLLVGAGTLSALVHAETLPEAFALAGRTAGRYLLLAMIVVVVAAALPAATRQRFAAVSLAALGTVEALFGLAAFVLPLGVGLEPTRRFSVLYFEVPGRIAGTLGISPNFLAAIFLLTIALTAGLALDAARRRDRIALWMVVAIQMLALVFTFTRASLGLAIVLLVVLVIVRGRLVYLLPVALAVAIGFATTPALQRLTADVPDRLALWTSAALMMADNPITGVGSGRAQEVARANPDRYQQTPFGTAAANAHNTILIAGAETGVAGAVGALLVNVALAIGALRLLIRNRRARGPAVEAAAALGVLAYLVQGQVNNLFTVAAAGTVFALVAGAFLAADLLRTGTLDASQELGSVGPSEADPPRTGG